MHPNITPAGLLLLLLASPLALAQSPCGDQVTVEAGDTLSRIANRCEVSLDELLAANPQIDNPNLISVGMTLTVPGAQPPAAEPEVVRAGPAAPPTRSGPSVGEMVGIREVRGTLTDQGVECQALQGDDGQLYTLTGDLQGLETGQRVYVRGRVAETSFCQQGTTLTVERIEPVEAAATGPEPARPRVQAEVTEDGLTRIEGELTEEGTTCPTLRGDDGRLYTLIGSLQGAQAGQRVTVTGSRAEESFCQQGITLVVEQLER